MSSLGDKALVISDPSDEPPGGLYVYDGGNVEIIDRVSTTGLGATPAGHVLRLPRSFDEAGSSGELIVYDERGVTSHHRLDGIADAHGVAWDGDAYASSRPPRTPSSGSTGPGGEFENGDRRAIATRGTRTTSSCGTASCT